MDPCMQRHLEAQVMDAVATMLVEGDRAYLRSLSREALEQAITQELGFLGFSCHGDTTTRARVHALVAHHLDQWYHQVQAAGPPPAAEGTQ
jgi:hypothetical protein